MVPAVRRALSIKIGLLFDLVLVIQKDMMEEERAAGTYSGSGT